LPLHWRCACRGGICRDIFRDLRGEAKQLAADAA
jgi:hypothetical protein